MSLISTKTREEKQKMQAPNITWNWRDHVVWEHKKPVTADSVLSFSYTHDENLIFTSTVDRQVKIWDAETG